MTAFIVGFPGALARAVARRIAEGQHKPVALLVPPKQMRSATAFSAQAAGAISCIEGSSDQIDYGLSGPEYLALAERATALLDLTLHPAPGRFQGAGDGVPPGGLRELIELGLAARGRVRVVALSHVDVAGNADRELCEADLELGQGFKDMAEAERLRKERILRRFESRLPITVARTGWVIGEGPGLCPLPALLLSLKDRAALPSGGEDGVVYCIDVDSLAGILASEAISGPGPGVRTLHLAWRNLPPISILAERARWLAVERASAGFDLHGAARRALRRDRSEERWWSARHFFRRQPYRMRLSTAETERCLAERGLALPEFDPAFLDRLVEREVERMMRPKNR